MKTLTKIFLASFFILLITICTLTIAKAQNIAITDDDAYSPESSAMLDIKSLTKGMLVPRLTSVQRVAITNKATGLLVFDTTEGSFYFYNGTTWVNLTSGNASGILGYTAPDKVYLTDINDNFGVGTNAPQNKLDIKADASNEVDQAIFNVVNNGGDTVFAVYPYGVRINVAKAPAARGISTKGGFAVGGFSPGRGVTDEYFTVSQDSVRIYFDEEGTRATKGGFAVGGFSPGRGLTNEHLRVTSDSTRVYVDGDEGFAIDNIAAGSEGRYMDLTPENYFIGHEGGKNITTGLYNQTMGYQAGKGLTEGDKNVFLGYQSGYSAEEDEDNVFIGYQSGYNTKHPSFKTLYNVFVGSQSGFSNTTGSYNTFLGYKAGYTNTTGGNNVFIGKEAGYKNTTGAGNVMLGNSAGYFCTSAVRNILIGTNSGWHMTDDDNITIGYYSARAQYSGEKNCYVGNYSAENNYGGSYNCVYGDHAGVGTYNNSYSQNSIFGYQSGYKLTTGSYNTFMGYISGYSNTTGYSNTFIGHKSGYSNVSGNYNVFLGRHAGYYETGSNKLYIDNSSTSSPLIYGDFTYNRVGINDGVPSANLHVKQSGTNEEGFAIENDGDTDVWSWEIGGNDLNLAFNGSNVGYWNDSDGAYYATSDRLLKKDIETIKEPILANVLKLELVDYRLIHADAKAQKTIGFIAQDVQKLLPNIVNQKEDGYLSLNYDNFGIISIKAIQEQQVEINNLKTEIEELKILINNIIDNN